MKNLLILFLIGLCTIGYSQRQETTGIAITIDKVINDVKAAIVAANDEIKHPLLKEFPSVTLSLETTYSSEKGGGLKLWIFSFGKTITKEKTHKVILTLAPPSHEKVTIKHQSFSEQLKNIIVEAIDGVKTSDVGDAPLVAKSLTVEFNFVVMKKKEAGLEWELIPVTASLKGNLHKKSVHNVKLEYKIKD